MADTAFTRTVMDKVAKYMQLGPVHSQFNEQSYIFNYFKPKMKPMAGRKWLVPVRTGGLAGVGNRAEAGTLPDAKTTTYAEPEIAPTYTYKPVLWTGQTKEFTGGSGNALVSGTVEAMEYANIALARDCARQLWGSSTGQIALANGAGTSSTTLTLDTPGTLYMTPGMDLDVSSSLTDATISTVDSDTQVTLSSAITWSDNDPIYVRGNKDIDAYGFQDIFYDGTNSLWGTGSVAETTVYGLTRSTNTWTYPHITASVGNSITINFQKAMAKAKQKSGHATNVIFCSPGVFSSFFYAHKALTHFLIPTQGDGKTPVLYAGHQKMFVNGVPIYDDPFAWSSDSDGPGVAVFLNTDYLEIYHTRPPFQGCAPTPTQTLDEEFTRLNYYWSGFSCRNFQAHAALTGITEFNVSAT